MVRIPRHIGVYTGMAEEVVVKRSVRFQAFIRLLLVSICGFAGSMAAQVNNYYISPTGSDSNSGTSASSPWLTFSHANSALALGPNGTVVHVASCPNGTFCYTGTINISRSGTPTQRITWQSDSQYGAKINGVVNIYGSYIDWNNFEQEDLSTADDAITTILNNTVPTYGTFLNITNNYIHDVKFTTDLTGTCPGGEGNSGITINGRSHDVLVDSNIVKNNGHWGGCTATSGTSAHGMYVQGFHNTITNNQVSNSAGYGIELYHNVCQNVVANNTVFHNFTGGIQVASGTAGENDPNATDCQASGNAYGSYTNNLLINNAFATTSCAASGAICTNHYRFGFVVGASGVGAGNMVFNNLLAGNVTSGGQNNTINVLSGVPSPAQGGNIAQTSTSGIFVNYQDDGSGDYHLVTGSPAASAGTSTTSVCASSPGIDPCVPNTDFAGVARVSPISAGVYQSGVTASAPSAPTGLVATVQ
jgi:parallel beta-helix repeat protein